ncbi:MAG: hypothetical protein KC646_13400 [Candidatus Cloacimonetes bacterium]|nr:hypothetical protein [Candidatus Cloacimonadota bacterium]
MIKLSWTSFLAFLVLLPNSYSEIHLSGAYSFLYNNGDSGRQNYVTGGRNGDSYNGFHVNKMEFYVEGSLDDNVTWFSEFDWNGSDSPNLSLAYLRFNKAFGKNLVIDAGKILNPLGLFLQRKSAHQNLLFGDPLLYDYHTTLRTDGVVANGAQIAGLAGLGGSFNNYANAVTNKQGLTLVDRDYPTGVMAYSRKDNVDYYLAFTNGAVSQAEPDDSNSSTNVLLKMAYVGSKNARLGFNYSTGAYLDSNVVVPAGRTSNDYRQTLYGFDFQYERQRWNVMAEWMVSSFETPNIASDLDSYGYYLEGQYFWNESFYGAVRFGGINFENIDTPLGKMSWDSNVNRTELGIGYYVNEQVLSKFYIQLNETDTTDPKDNLLGFQLAGTF